MCGNIFVFPSGCVYSQVMGIHHVHMSFLLMCRDCYFMPLNIHLKNQIQRLHRTGSWHVYFTNLWFFKQFELFASICHCTKNPQWRLTGLGLHTHTDPLIVVTHVLQYFFELLPLFISNPVPSSWRCRPVSLPVTLCVMDPSVLWPPVAPCCQLACSKPQSPVLPASGSWVWPAGSFPVSQSKPWRFCAWTMHSPVNAIKLQNLLPMTETKTHR